MGPRLGCLKPVERLRGKGPFHALPSPRVTLSLSFGMGGPPGVLLHLPFPACSRTFLGSSHIADGQSDSSARSLGPCLPALLALLPPPSSRQTLPGGVPYQPVHPGPGAPAPARSRKADRWGADCYFGPSHVPGRKAPSPIWGRQKNMFRGQRQRERLCLHSHDRWRESQFTGDF